MIGQVRAEWIKWRSLRSSFALLTTILLLSGIFATIAALTFHSNDTAKALDVVDGNPIFVSMFLGLIGALLICSEYSQGTLTPTFLSTPRRIQVLASKVLFGVVLALGIALVAQLFAFLVGSLLLARDGVSIALSDPGVIRQLAESTLFAACGVMFGLAIGVVLRQTVAAVVICITWPILIESLLGASLPKNLQSYLPFNALRALLSSVQGPDGSGYALSPLGGVAVYFAWIAILMVVGAWFMNRADAK